MRTEALLKTKARQAQMADTGAKAPKVGAAKLMQLRWLRQLPP